MGWKRWYIVVMAVTVAVTGAALTRISREIREAIPVGALSEGPVLIIDAGHGGEDGGAAGNGLLESQVNLDIALRLDALAGLWGLDAALTRESEDIDYPGSAATTRARKIYDQNRRLELINSARDAVLISIHQNNYPAAAPRGPQVFFVPEGRELAEITQANLTAVLYPQNRRLAVEIPDSIYLMRKAQCPAVLVECGFLSNPDEAALLSSGEYRLRISALLLASYIQYCEAVI